MEIPVQEAAGQGKLKGVAFQPFPLPLHVFVIVVLDDFYRFHENLSFFPGRRKEKVPAGTGDIKQKNGEKQLLSTVLCFTRYLRVEWNSLLNSPGFAEKEIADGSLPLPHWGKSRHRVPMQFRSDSLHAGGSPFQKFFL